MIRLKTLTLRAFRSFADEATVEFPEHGLVLIRGQNHANHDSSGTGKSTILLAISYALDICPFPASELQSWLTDEPMQVRLELETPDSEVVIQRGKKNSLKVGDLTVTGAKAISEGIRKLLGLDTETLRAITYRPQDNPGLFLSLKDSEKKEFLTGILGLADIERAVDVAEGRVKVLAPELSNKEAIVTQLESEIATLSSQSIPEGRDYGELVTEKDRLKLEIQQIEQFIQVAWRKAEQSKSEILADSELIRLQDLVTACTGQYQAVVKNNTERYNVFQERKELNQKKLREVVRQEGIQVNLAQRVGEIRQQRDKALEGKCPTCLRIWDEASKKAEEYSSVIFNFEAQISVLSGFTSTRKQIETDLKETFQEDPLVEKLRILKGQLESQYEERKTKLFHGPLEEAQARVGELNIQKAAASTRFHALDEQIATIKSLNEKLSAARKTLESNLKSVQDRLEMQRKAAETIRVELAAERDFLGLMGKDGFLGVIFDDILREIEIEANDRLGRLANTSHITIQFKTEVVTQKGTVNRIITPVAMVNGVEAKLRSGLSGGQYTSLEVVVDLALMAVVQRRTGSLPGFLFLDESFNGMGSASKESYMEVLKEYAEEKLVIVIDHSSEFKEMFSNTILVGCDNGKSSIISVGEK